MKQAEINTTPLISIALCTYNGEQYLVKQLDSIINQTYKNIEIIILDDVSVDGTLEIIKSYAAQYKFIHYYSNDVNLGIVKSFSKALLLCEGEYIALSDQDDIWFPQKLEILLGNIGSNLLIHSDAVLIDEKDNIIAASHFKLSKNMSNVKFDDYLVRNNVTGCSVMISKDLRTLACPIPSGFYVHDHYLALVASYYGAIKLFNEPLIYYRQHSNNSIGASRPAFDEFIQLCRIKADSYALLLELMIFPGKAREIEFMRDFRLSIYKHKWHSQFSVLRVLCFSNGFQLLLFYFVFVIIPKRFLSKILYNFIFKLKR